MYMADPLGRTRMDVQAKKSNRSLIDRMDVKRIPQVTGDMESALKAKDDEPHGGAPGDEWFRTVLSVFRRSNCSW